MTKKILMVGLNPKIVNIIESIKEDISLYIIEEEELYRNNFNGFSSKLVKGIKTGAYQQSFNCVEVACKWHEEIEFNAVMPGREYSVLAVNEIAKQLKLKRLGDLAAGSLTNKFKMRNEASKLGILQPEYKKINNFEDLLSFYQNKPFILKPTNRQASVGVVKVEKKEELEAAWNEVINAAEGNMVVSGRSLTWEYMAEDFIEGYEISVESFVKDGQALFNNITRKITTASKYSVEIGHIVPGALPEKDKRSVLIAKKLLIKGLGMQNGLLHSEWIVNDKGPHLIECAGRAPGGLIPELFELSYNLNLFKAFIYILCGDEIDFPKLPSNIACVYYFTPQPGKLISVTGIENLRKVNGFVRVDLPIKPGQVIKPLTSNWGRTGYVILKASSREMLDNVISEAGKAVKFEVE